MRNPLHEHDPHEHDPHEYDPHEYDLSDLRATLCRYVLTLCRGYHA